MKEEEVTLKLLLDEKYISEKEFRIWTEYIDRLKQTQQDSKEGLMDE